MHGQVRDEFKPFMVEQDGQWIISPQTHNAFRKDKLDILDGKDNLSKRVAFSFAGQNKSATVKEILSNLMRHTKTFDVLKKHYETDTSSSFDTYLQKINQMIGLRDRLKSFVAGAAQGFVSREDLAKGIADAYQELKPSIKADRDGVNQVSIYALVEMLISEGWFLLLGIDHRYFGNFVMADLEISLNRFLSEAMQNSGDEALLDRISCGNDNGTERVRDIDPKISDSVGKIKEVVQKDVMVVIDGGDEALVGARVEGDVDKRALLKKLEELSVECKLRIFGMIVQGLDFKPSQLPISTKIEDVSKVVRDGIAQILQLRAGLGAGADALKLTESLDFAGLQQPSVQVEFAEAA